MILLFDGFELDTRSLELRRSGCLIDIEPKAFDLILLLAGNADRVISRDEIVQNLWQGRAVSDAALATCIKAARRALGDDGKSQRFIRTYLRRGIRFVGTVTVDTKGERVAAVAVAPPRATSMDAPAMPEACVGSSLQLPEGPSIAILPFDLVGSGDDQYGIALGLARDITTRLGRAHWLFVIARGSAFKLRPDAVQEVGATLAARYALQGSVQVNSGHLRANIALIDTLSRSEIWSELFDRRIDDVFVIQDEIAEAIATHVPTRIERVERRRAALKPMASLDAWSAYHRGWWHMDRHSPGEYEQAAACFKLAMQLDPTASRAAAGLSAVHRQRAFLNLTRTRRDEIGRAFDLAQQSLTLDRLDPQAHWAMGRAMMLLENVPSALSAFEAASRLNPCFAMSQYSVGFGRAMVGDSADSELALSRALRLSPIDPMRFAMLATKAFNAALSGKMENAADLAKLAAAEPYAHYHIIAIAALCSALASRAADAKRFASRLRSVRPMYGSADFFRAFPFQTTRDVQLWQKGFRLIGLA